MSIYDSDGSRVRVSVKLTKHQKSKLDAFCALFGKTAQSFFADAVDFMYADTYEIQTGRSNSFSVTKQTAQKVLDSYVELDRIKGLQPAPYTREHR